MVAYNIANESTNDFSVIFLCIIYLTYIGKNATKKFEKKQKQKVICGHYWDIHPEHHMAQRSREYTHIANTIIT